MKCDKCFFYSEASAKFCNQCGSALRRACPRCGELNVPGSRFCKNCGEGLDSSVPDSAVVSAVGGTVAEGSKICPACRTVNEASSVFCYKCGVALPAQVLTRVQALGNPAGFWVRLAAFLIDNLIIGVFVIMVAVLLSDMPIGKVFGAEFGSPSWWRVQIISEAFSVAYFTFAIGKWGQTAGKALLRLKVTRVDGSRLTYWRSFARFLSYYLSSLTIGFGFLLIALTSHKRGLHDYVCNTRVLKLT